MNSMTGYGRAMAVMGVRSLTVQINSVNRKGLDLTVKLPEEWQAFEPAIGDAVRKVALRGKVHVAIEVTGDSGVASSWDEAAVGRVLDELGRLAASRGLPFAPDAGVLWSIASAQRSGNSLPVDESAGSIVLGAVDEALRSFAAMRATEGRTLLQDFLARLEKLKVAIDVIAQRAPQVTAAYREQLSQRLRQAGLELDINDERVLKEVALFADRCDITEELTRLRSHAKQLHDLLTSRGEIGRKAEFILQEIGREIHTIGSKANDLAISQQVIEFKNELERVREQIANVE